jgi:CxxC motif-containing protein (DUF1111 family)
MTNLRAALLSVGILGLVAACGDSTDNSTTNDSDALSGGETTVFNATSAAFSFPAPNLSAADLGTHLAGDAGFEVSFVTAPAPVNPGLGPLFNNNSCVSCHTGDGRGRPPLPGEQLTSMLFRLSVPGTDANGGPNPVPGFGTQLQQRASQGMAGEAAVTMTYAESTLTFGDGANYSLYVPTYTVSNPYTPFPGTVLTSPRVAPPNFGLGLLEAIPEATIVGMSDEADADGDGISGKANFVYDPIAGTTKLGRFGWKANTATLLTQTAGAYNADIGITSSYLPLENCSGQYPGCPVSPQEVSDAVVQAVAFYVRTLGVPARRLLSDAQARQGEAVFKAAKCTACHVQTQTTGTLAGVPEVSDQKIHPYTDMLVHDMGPALADGRPDFLATGSEWRTAPLWGIGLTPLVNGHSNFLHDGRARSLLEAVLWHGGEATAAREYVRNASAADRSALIRFLESL